MGGNRIAGRARRTRFQRLATTLGVALILGAFGWLGWIGWQYFGTNWVAKQDQEKIVASVEGAWKEGKRSVTVAEGVRADAVIRIPRFGTEYAIPVLEGTSDAVLAQGYGHFSGTAAAGAKGNYAVAAHRVTHGEPLRRMPELQPGDQIIVETRDKRIYYELDTAGSALTVDFTAGWVLDDLPKNPREGGTQPEQRAGQQLITLTTCSELFNTDNRLIAFGHLVKVETLNR